MPAKCLRHFRTEGISGRLSSPTPHQKKHRSKNHASEITAFRVLAQTPRLRAPTGSLGGLYPPSISNRIRASLLPSVLASISLSVSLPDFGRACLRNR